MTRFLAPLLIGLAATPSLAAERRFTITSFDRIRMEAPFDVVLTAFSPHMHVRGKAARYEYDVTDPKTKKTETKETKETKSSS